MKKPPENSRRDSLPPLVARNVNALVKHRREEDRHRSWHDRLADGVTRFAGSMPFVYLHLLLFGTWIIVNLPGVPLPKFDPTYVVLAMFASVEAIFLSTFVLITQNRMSAAAEKRAELDLQISLLTEHELTKAIHLLTAICDQMNLKEAQEPDLDRLQKDVEPEAVLEKIDEIEASQQQEEDVQPGGTAPE